MTATIRKKASRKRFVVIDQETIRDRRLSWKARGLLAYLLSLPDDWEISFRHLMKESPHDKATALRSAFKELMTAGYAGREVIRSSDNKRAQGTRYFVTEECMISTSSAEMQETSLSDIPEMQETRTSENVTLRNPDIQETCPHTKDLPRTKNIKEKKERTSDICYAREEEIQPLTCDPPTVHTWYEALAPAEVPEAIRHAQCADNLSEIALLRATLWPEDAILDQQVPVQIYTEGGLHDHSETPTPCGDDPEGNHGTGRR